MEAISHETQQAARALEVQQAHAVHPHSHHVAVRRGSCGIGSCGVPRPSLAHYVTGMGPWTERPLPEVLVLPILQTLSTIISFRAGIFCLGNASDSTPFRWPH